MYQPTSDSFVLERGYWESKSREEIMVCIYITCPRIVYLEGRLSTYSSVFIFAFYFVVNIRNFVINSLRVTNEELKTENTFTLLTKIVEQESPRHNDDDGSITSLNKYKNELSQLDKQIAETEASFMTEIQLKRRIIEEQTVSIALKIY